MNSIARVLVAAFVVACFGAQRCVAQEVQKDLTAEEIVARHEATWAKLRRIAANVETKNRMTVGGSSVRESEKGERVVDFRLTTSETATKMQLFLDGDRVSARCQVRESRIIPQKGEENCSGRVHAAPVRQETREIFDNGLLVHWTDKHVSIEKERETWPRMERFALGKSLALFVMSPQKSLREWVAEARPKITPFASKSGESLWLLEGAFTGVFHPTVRPPGDRVPTYQVQVLVNATRGCLIEKVHFDCAKHDAATAPKESEWRVETWHDLGNGLSFPGKVRCDLTYWNMEEKSYTQWNCTDVALGAPDFEKQFQYELADGMEVFDRTGRPGTTPVSIWGPDGKPKKTYATHKAYQDEQDATRIAEMVRQQETTVAKMFPGCTVKATLDAKANDFHTIVYDETGIVLREFKSNEELAVIEGVQELIRVALRKKEVK